MEVYFQYVDGARVRKLTVKGGRTEERVYVGGVEEYRAYVGSDPLDEEAVDEATFTEHAPGGLTLDIKLRRHGKPVAKPKPLYRYALGNHLGSTSLEVDEDGKVVSYEEYHPYGTTAYRAVRSGVDVDVNRYRFTGMERDEETGLAQHGWRYFASWLGRWGSADPIGLGDGLNRYAYCGGNPVGYVDPTGTRGIGDWFADVETAAVEGLARAGESLRGGYQAVGGAIGRGREAAATWANDTVSEAAGEFAGDAAEVYVRGASAPLLLSQGSAIVSSHIVGSGLSAPLRFDGGVQDLAHAVETGNLERGVAAAGEVVSSGAEIAGMVYGGVAAAMEVRAAVAAGEFGWSTVTSIVRGESAALSEAIASGRARSGSGSFRSLGAMAAESSAPKARPWTPSSRLDPDTVRMLSDSRPRARGASAAAGAGVDDALLPNLSNAEIDAAFANRNLGSMVEAPAAGISGSGPKVGGPNSNIWFHDNLRVQGASPTGGAVNIRTHSANPGAPAGSFSSGNYTTQIHTNSGRYLLPDGSWKKIHQMTPAERAAAHTPAGN